MKFAREGLPIVFGLGVATLVANLLGWWWLGLVLLVLVLFSAWFFRDPDRQVPEGRETLVSPADGKVVSIADDQIVESVAGQRFRRISIFMSPLDVHVNRIPVDGTIVSVKHTPGKFLAAYSEAASFENERNEIVLRDSAGRIVVFVQIAGLLARRILCHVRPGDAVTQGARYGLIMFGSRVDVYLPTEALVRVAVGDRVCGGSAVLAELAEARVAEAVQRP